MNCEAVCRRWRDILLAESLWKRLLDWNKEKSSSWRRAQRVLEKNQLTLRTGPYRAVCKDVLQVQCNWHTGNFTKFNYRLSRGDTFTLTISDDYVAWQYLPSVEPETCEGCTFLDTESMEITKIPLYCPYKIGNGMLLRWDTTNTTNICNPKFNWNIDDQHEDFIAGTISYGSGLLVGESLLGNREQRVEVWKICNPPILLRTRKCGLGHLYIWEVDERFFVAHRQLREFNPEKAVTWFFISTETLEVFTSVSAMNYECNLYESEWDERAMNFKCVYDQDLLFQYRGNGEVRILDVASGNYINTMRIPFRSKDKKFIKLTSSSEAPFF